MRCARHDGGFSRRRAPSAIRARLRTLSGLAALLLLALPLAACSAFTNYNRRMEPARAAFANGDFPRAHYEIVSRMRGAEGAREKRLAPWLERGMVEHTSGAFGASAVSWQRGVEIVRADEERAVVSASRTAAEGATLVVNEKMRPYSGESFEKILLPTFLMLNYAMRQDWEGARVEARRAWQRQGELARRHETELADAQEGARRAQRAIDVAGIEQRLDGAYAPQIHVASRVANAYQNAFSHALAAVVYNALDERNEAYVELKRADRLRPGAPCLGPMLIETAWAGGFREDLPRWESAYGLRAEEVLREARERRAELVVVFENGWGPLKRQLTIPLPTPMGIVTLALPIYEPQPGAALALRIEAEGKSAATNLLGDIEAQAARALRDRMAIYVLKALVRVTARAYAEYEMQRAAEDKHGDTGAVLAFLASSAANILLEQADLRCWSLLPRDLQMARLRLSEGEASIRLRLEGAPEASVETLTMGLRADRPNIVLVRSLGPRLYIHTNEQQEEPNQSQTRKE